MKRVGWSTVVCAATGPSFSRAQAVAIQSAQITQGYRVIAINDAYRLLNNADVLYACDGRWWDVHLLAIRKAGFAGELWTQDTRAMPGYFGAGGSHVRSALPGLHWINSKPAPGLGRGLIHQGKNSGYQAINLAYLFGASRIILVGYDMQRTGGAAHFFGEHPSTLSREIPFDIFLKYFGPLAIDLKQAGVDVINSTEGGALEVFRREPLSKSLEAASV